MRLVTACLVLFLTLGSGAAWADSFLDPAHTRVVVVGVLEWQRSDLYGSFSSKDRRDARLAETFQRMGVPADRLTYLCDSQATLQAIHSALTAQLAASGPGDTLVFYYCGHGDKDGKGDTLLANYDAQDEPSSCLSVKWLVDSVAREFQGDRVVLLADCCCSGGLVDQVSQTDLNFAALASSSANEVSTGDWTFSQDVLDALNGNGLLDADRNGSISLAELTDYLITDMAVFHGQRASVATRGSLGPEDTLASVTHPAPAGARVGERVEAQSEGEWWKARIVEEKNDRLKVRWTMIGYDTETSDEWVDPARVRSLTSTTYPAGSRVEVEWQGDWYPARILEASSGVHRVHYDGYDEEWDEWVPAGRIRTRG